MERKYIISAEPDLVKLKSNKGSTISVAYEDSRLRSSSILTRQLMEYSVEV